jgi:predicted nuclease with TOPRIM domain
MDSVDRMFHVCIDHLRESYQLWRTAQRMTGKSQENTLRQRAELIQEVEQSVSHLEQTIDQLQTVTTKRSKSELSRLREELDETIRVAKRVEQRTEELVENQKPYDPAEFE